MSKAPKEKNPLGQLVDEINEKQVIADSNPRIRIIDGKETTVTMPHVIRNMKARKDQAKRAVQDLFAEYRTEVGDSAAFVVVVGDAASDFATKAQEQLSTFSYSATQLYEDVVDKIPEKIYVGRVSDKTLLEHIIARFEDRAFDIGIKGYKGFVLERKFVRQMKTKKDVVNLMADMFHEHIGTEVLGMDAIHRAAKDGVAAGFGGMVVPIVLHTESLSIAQKLVPSLVRLSPHVVSIKAGKLGVKEKLTADISIDKVTNKSVEEAMLKVKDRVM